MKDFFKKYLSEEKWFIREDVWDRRFQDAHETLFTLGNGYLGSRGVLEEIPYDAYPGTYVAGVYDTSVAQVSEIVNLPNPVDFRIVAEGEKVDVVAMDVLKHKRILDMKHGLLCRHTIFSNTRKERFDYQSLRFFSMEEPHIGCMQIYFTPLDKPIGILIQNEINTTVTNKGILTEGRKRHIRIVRIAKSKNINYLSVRTLESKISVAYADYLVVYDGKNSFNTSEMALRLNLKKGQTACFTCMYSILTSRDTLLKRLKGLSIRTLRRAVKKGFQRLIEGHIKIWSQKWSEADICVKPDSELQRALRFNIYHLLICGNEQDPNVSVGARTLSGEGYRGHVFWDAEIFIMPFFIYTNPKVARNMLLYRYNRLSAAKKIAKNQDFKGALFPWESARRGMDATPPWHKGLDGRIIKIYTGEREHHIVSDIAYATCHYFSVTGDESFMLEAGLELMIETARFWASRVSYDRENDIYHIKGVIGPDEAHEYVDDNAYTNAMARFNLLKAAYFYKNYKQKAPGIFKKLIRRMNVSDEEVRGWEEISEKIFIPFSKEKKIIESFSGYFKKKDVYVTALDDHFMPVMPKEFSYKDIEKTQLLKQADVVMLLYSLSENYSLKEKMDNFLYYEKRSLHKSSLSSCIHTIVASEVGEFRKAHRYFLYSLYGDLKNLYGNITDGIHAASLGGTWQAVINGFGGVRIINDTLSFSPNLPPFLKEIKFRIKYKEFALSVAIYKDRIEILSVPQVRKRGLAVLVCGRKQELFSNRKSIFKRGRAIRPCSK